MRKKYTCETYLRGVLKCNIKIKEFKENNAYIVIKEIQEIDKPFVKSKTLLDNGFYIIEYTPLDELYNARAFVDDKFNVICYYFDISMENGVDNGRPFYIDAYLDIVLYPSENNKLEVLDSDELKEALENNNITREQYDLANNICNQLVKEIEKNDNKFILLNKKMLIKEE